MIRVAATRHARPHLRARLRAAAEATAAKEQAEYERLIAEKENEMKQQETEEEKRRPQALAQHDRDIAVMSANKWVAAANARLKAIQESMLEREINDLQELSNMDITDCQERTMAWVHSSTPKRTTCCFQESLTHPQVDTPTRVRTLLKIDTPSRDHTSLESLEREVPLLKDTPRWKAYPNCKLNH